MADSDILLTVGLDPRDAVQDAKDLAGEVRKVFDSQSGKELSSKQTALNAQLKKNTQAADELGKKMGELADKRIAPTEELRKYQAEMQQIQANYDELLQKQETYIKSGEASGKYWVQLQKDIEKTELQMENLETSMEQLEDAGRAFILGKDTEEYKKMEVKLGQINDQTKVALIKQQEMSDETEKTSKHVGRATKSLGIFTNLTGAARKGFHSIAGAVKNVERRLKGGFIRLLGMVVGVRGLFSIFMKMRSAVREGFQNLMKADKNLKKQFDDLKDSADELKANLAAAFLPLIQLAIPYVQKLIQWVDQLIAKIAMFVAAVAGQNAYTRAIKKTSDAAKEANKQLSKLDELNVLQTQDEWGTSTEQVPIEMTEKIQKLLDTLKSDNWFDLGRGLADSIENFFDSIDWDKIKENARKFAKRLATFLNGFFKPEMFYKAGNFIAQAINTAIEWALEFGKDLDWKNIGHSISEAIRGFFENFDWAKLAETINVWVQGLWDLLKGFFGNKEMWKSIFSGLFEFFSHIELKTVALLAAPGLVIKLGKTLLAKIAGAFGTSALSDVNLTSAAGGTKVTVSNKLVESIATVLSAAIGAELGGQYVSQAIYGKDAKFSVFGDLIPAMKKDADEVIGIYSNYRGNLDEQLTAIEDGYKRATIWTKHSADEYFFWNIFAGKQMVQGWDNLASNITSRRLAINDQIKKLESDFTERETLAAIIDHWIGKLTPDELIQDLQALGFSVDDIKQGFVDAQKTLSDTATVADSYVIDALERAGATTSDLARSSNEAGDRVTGLNASLAGMPESAREGFLKAGGHFADFKSVVANSMDEAEQSIEEFEQSVDDFGNSMDTLEEVGTNFSDTFGTNWSEMWDGVAEDWDSAKKKFGDIQKFFADWEKSGSDSFNQLGDTVKQVFETKASLSCTSLENSLTKIRDFIQTTFGTEVPNIFKSATNSVIGFINTMLVSLEGALNNVADVINNLQWKIPDVVPDIGGKEVNFSMNRVSLNRIPALASGTVIPPSMGRFIAQLGDNNRETEVVSPLSTIEEAVANVLERVGFGGGDIHIHVDLDGREIAKSVVRQNDIYRKSRGRSMFA